MSEDKQLQNLQNAVAAYLKSQGWSVVVVGKTGVMQFPNSLKYNFTFFMEFTAKQKVVTGE